MIVTKFGGTSMADAGQFRKVRNIILDDPERRVVVVSAPGRRYKGDTKVTDLLYTLYMHLQYSVPYEDIWQMIAQKYTDIARDLGLSDSINVELEVIHSELRRQIDQNYLISRGEFLAARLMSEYLGFPFIDAQELIRFSYDGKVDQVITDEAIAHAAERMERFVIPGFYGAYPNGDICLFSRGGSDITGAYLTRGLGAKIYENWTDVSGVLAADPRVVDNPRIISNITYAELREMSYMGANVLHEESVSPVADRNININIRNTNEPKEEGTLIQNECDGGPIITGITGMKDFVSFDITKEHLANEVGFVRKVLEIFERYKVNVEHLPTGIDTVSVIVSASSVNHCMYDIVSGIERTLEAQVSVRRDISLLAVVGRNMAGKVGVCSRLFSALAGANISVKMIAQSPDETNIMIGLDNSDYEKATRALYSNFLDCGWL